MHSTIALLPYNCLSHIFVFLLFANPYLFILMCDIFPFYSCRECVHIKYIYVYIYMKSILFIFVFIVSFYCRFCLSLWFWITSLVWINIYPLSSFLSWSVSYIFVYFHTHVFLILFPIWILYMYKINIFPYVCLLSISWVYTLCILFCVCVFWCDRYISILFLSCVHIKYIYVFFFIYVSITASKT